MSLIEWQENYCTGIPGVDHEHQELIRQINEIYTLIDAQADRDTVIDSLGDIYGSISAHFALEEQMMEKHHYDQFREHQADHNRLLDEIRDITLAYETAEQLDTAEFKQKLNDWFQQHFSTHDARLHSLAELMQHETVAEPALKAMIRSAKNRLLGRHGRH